MSEITLSSAPKAANVVHVNVFIVLSTFERDMWCVGCVFCSNCVLCQLASVIGFFSLS